MRLTARSSLADVAVIVGDALRRAQIHAVLTGGACAYLYSGGVRLSRDADRLAVAVAIAMRHRISFAKVRDWSRREGCLDEYAVFLAELRRARARGGRPK